MAHPAFPVITGVWFAALFGLGAVAAGGEALAALAGHLHLTAIVPSAAPPLGTTAHILIAAGLTLLGAAFGIALGLALHARAAGVSPILRIRAGLARVRTAKPAAAPREATAEPAPRIRNRDAHPDAPPRRPLVVTEDVLPYHAQDPVFAPVAPADPMTVPPAWTAQTMDADIAPVPEETPLGAFMTGHPGAQIEAQPAEVPPFFGGHFGETPPLAQSGIYAPGEAVVLPPETGEPADLAHALPVLPQDAEPVFDAASLPKSAPLASQATAAPQDPIVEAPVATLGLVQLIERLALAITVRQALRSNHVAPAPDEEPLLRAKPSRLGRVDEAPVAAEATDDLPPRFLRNTPEPQPTEPASDAAEDTFVAPHSIFGALRTDAVAGPQYSSLANMTLVRPDLPTRPADGASDPVVQFPLHASDNAAPARGQTNDADRALRDALATLRRMSAQR